MNQHDDETAALRLAAIVESSDDAIVSKDLDGIVQTWNPAAERLFGYRAAEIIGRSIRLIIPDERQPEEDEVLRQIRLGHAVAHFETERLRRDGSLVSVSLTVSPVRDTRGVVIGASKIARDISERHRAGAVLAASEEGRADLHRRLLELVAASGKLLALPSIDQLWPAIVTLASDLIPADGHAVWRHDRVKDSWRIEASRGLSDAFVTASVAAVSADGARFALTAPLVVEDLERTPPMLEARRALYRDEGVRSMLAVPLSPLGETTGTVVFYYRTLHQFGHVETPTAVALANLASAAIGSATLFEAQRRSRIDADFLAESGKILSASLDYEETLKAVARLAVPYFADWCAVDLVDGDHVRRLATSHVDPERVALAERFVERYPEDPTSAYSVAAVIRTGRSAMMARVPEARLHQGARSAEHAAAVRELDIASFMVVPLQVRGASLGAITFAAGESGRTYDEADLRLAQEVAYRAAAAVDNARVYAEVRRANRIKDDFLATLSHELRTPLNALVGYTRMLKLGILAAEGHQRAYDVIDRNATALTRIVNDVLDVSRIVSGKVRLSLKRIDMTDAVRQSLESVQLAADAKGVRLEVHLPGAPAFVDADPDRVQQLVWNLLSNAVKFTPRGGRVDVAFSVTAADVVVRVRDTGIGIEADFLPHVFERFEQADSRYAREHGGLGLGLAIAHHLVEMHGGTIAAESDGPGTGATFTVCLPRIVSSAIAADPAFEAGERAAHPADRLAGVRVLVVDDDQDALRMLREVLSGVGATVVTAASGAEALAHLGAQVVDVLVTDIGMPGMDGLDLIARVRSNPDPVLRRLPAAALTAYARSEERERVLQAGFDTHLSKPVEPALIVATLLDLARARRG